MSGTRFLRQTMLLKKRAADSNEIYNLIKIAHTHLDAAKKDSDPNAWNAENRYLTLVDAWLRFDIARVNLYAATRQGKNRESGRKFLRDAYLALDDVYQWGDDNIADKKYLRNYKLIIIYSWELRIDRINGEYYMPKWKWPFVKLYNMARLGWLYFMLSNAYK